MKEKDRNVKEFWQNFKMAAIESGILKKTAEWYVTWSQRFAKSMKGTPLRSRSKKDVIDFLQNLSLQKGIDEWQVKQAANSLEFLYREFLSIDLGIDPNTCLRNDTSSKKHTERFIFKDTAISQKELASQYKELFDRFRTELRILHYSLRTERSYEMWIRRFLAFHNKKPIDTLGASEIKVYLPFIRTTWKRAQKGCRYGPLSNVNHHDELV